MVAPRAIEIMPPPAPVTAEVTIPGSKSLANPALVVAALADGEIVLDGTLWSEDTEVMSDCLRRLGITLPLPSAALPHRAVAHRDTV